MSEGVDLIDIYADEEFNQVRGISSSFGFSSVKSTDSGFSLTTK